MNTRSYKYSAGADCFYTEMYTPYGFDGNYYVRQINKGDGITTWEAFLSKKGPSVEGHSPEAAVSKLFQQRWGNTLFIIK